MPALGAVAMEMQVQEELRSIVLSLMLNLLHFSGICLHVCVCGQMIPHSPPVSPAFLEFLFFPFHRTQAQFCWLQSQHLQQQLSRQLERCVNVKTHLKPSSWLNKPVFMLSVYAVQAKEDVWAQGGKKEKMDKKTNITLKIKWNKNVFESPSVFIYVYDLNPYSLWCIYTLLID